MRTILRKVGNSRGIIIPAALLAACEMADEVDIRLEGKSLVIVPVHAPRSGWFVGYKPEADNGFGGVANSIQRVGYITYFFW